MMEGVKLEKELIKEQQKLERSDVGKTLFAFKTLLSNQDGIDQKVLDGILNGNEELSNLDISLLDPDKIFHENSIKKLCTDYRLRFLSSRYFKGEIPYEAIAKVGRMQKSHDTTISNFKIMAPAPMFDLTEKDKDPLLFLPLGNKQYYLVHKWGSDLHPLRRLLVYPFRSFQTLIASVAFLALIVSIAIPSTIIMGPYDSTSLNIRVILFFYLFLAFSGLTALYGFSRLKNFNSTLWNSRYLD